MKKIHNIWIIINDINQEKSRAIINKENKTLEDLIKNLEDEIPDFIMKSFDVNYETNYYNTKTKQNNKIKREEKIIFFGTKEMFSNFKNIFIKQFFVDITFIIIPYKFKPYKMLTIKGFNYEENKSVLCALACLIFEDEKSLFYTIKYLVDCFEFKPEIIITDFSLSLNKTLQ